MALRSLKHACRVDFHFQLQKFHIDVMGLMLRVVILIATLSLNQWQITGEAAWRFLFLFWATIGITELAVWNHQWFIKENGSRVLLKWDISSLLLGIILLGLLLWIPGRWGLVIGELPSYFITSINIRKLLCQHYQVFPPKRKRRKGTK